ncbi:MAG: thioredoxin family protein [Bacteroidales bacterium]|nr:thioredoxin family protein [Bacteroidales bacterium]
MSVLATILSLMLLAAPAPAPDSLDFGKLDVMLQNYTEAIAAESTDVKSSECDFLIGSVKDSLTTQHIALWLYDKYRESELMGDEAVAIHIYDSWFKPGIIAMRSEFDKLDADIFATFNRNTLLGMKAPAVDLKGPCGRKVRIPQDGSHSILFFFDTSCGKCQLEAKVLPGIIEKVEFPTKVYAVYCGQSKKEWQAFRRSFKVRNKRVGVVHAWDPEMESDYLRLYGVMSTPRLYFTDTDGEILGRRLEPESLAELIIFINAYYGQKEKQ